MREHVAVLADPKQFEMATAETRPQGDGVSVVVAKRSDSLTREGVAYRFSAETFTTEQAEAWLAERGVRCERIECATEPESPTVEFESEVLYAGTFRPQRGGGDKGEVTITEADLREMAESTNRVIDGGWMRPPSKLGHGDDQEKVRTLFPEGGEPALGWIRRMEVRGERLVAMFADVPRRFAAAIKEGRWKPGSVEVLPRWVDPRGGVHTKVVSAFAWLGGVRPAAGGLETIGLSDEDAGILVLSVSHEPEDTTGQPSPASGEDHHTENADRVSAEINPSQEEIEMATIEELTAALNAEREARVKDRLARAATDRRIKPGEVETKAKIALGMDDATREIYLAEIETGPQAADLTKPLADGNPDPAQVKPSPKKGEARLIELAEKIAEDRKVSYGEALCLASVAEPETYSTYYVEAHPLRSAGKEN